MVTPLDILHLNEGLESSVCLFILASEILFIRIRQNEQMKGICISDHELKIARRFIGLPVTFWLVFTDTNMVNYIRVLNFFHFPAVLND